MQIYAFTIPLGSSTLEQTPFRNFRSALYTRDHSQDFPARWLTEDIRKYSVAIFWKSRNAICQKYRNTTRFQREHNQKYRFTLLRRKEVTDLPWWCRYRIVSCGWTQHTALVVKTELRFNGNTTAKRLYIRHFQYHYHVRSIGLRACPSHTRRKIAFAIPASGHYWSTLHSLKGHALTTWSGYSTITLNELWTRAKLSESFSQSHISV